MEHVIAQGNMSNEVGWNDVPSSGIKLYHGLFESVHDLWFPKWVKLIEPKMEPANEPLITSKKFFSKIHEYHLLFRACN